MTSLVILHSNCRTATSNQTEPHLQESNTGLKTPNPIADYVQDPSSLVLILNPSGWIKRASKILTVFLNSLQCLCCDRITSYSTEVVWEGGDTWKAAYHHMLRASPWKRAAGKLNRGQPQQRRVKISMLSCTKMSQDGTNKISNPLTYNIRRGKMVPDINHHRITQVSLVVDGENNFINNIT